MSERKQIHGASMAFSDKEVKILIEHFGCKNWDDLSRAALRYESLFFMFCDESGEPEFYPGEDFKLVLMLAERFVFENFNKTDERPQRRYFEKPKRGPGRSRKSALPDDLAEKLKEARKHVSTNEDAMQRLKALGAVPEHVQELKSKTILKYIDEHEAQKRKESEEVHRRCLEAAEAFKQFAPPPNE